MLCGVDVDGSGAGAGWTLDYLKIITEKQKQHRQKFCRHKASTNKRDYFAWSREPTLRSWTGGKGQRWQSPTLTGNKFDLLTKMTSVDQSPTDPTLKKMVCRIDSILFDQMAGPKKNYPDPEKWVHLLYVSGSRWLDSVQPPDKIQLSQFKQKTFFSQLGVWYSIIPILKWQFDKGINGLKKGVVFCQKKKKRCGPLNGESHCTLLPL